MLEFERPVLDAHALTIASCQYYAAPDEGIEKMFARVAKAVASSEAKSVRKKVEQEYYELMLGKRFCPGGRVLAGAGSAHGNLLNCFVQDGSPKRPGMTPWVLELAKKLALVTQSRVLTARSPPATRGRLPPRT